MNKHHVTDSKGNVHTRNSATRLYTHAVIIHAPEREEHGRHWDAHTRCEYASSRQLAELNAANWRKRRPEFEIEIQAVKTVSQGVASPQYRLARKPYR